MQLRAIDASILIHGRGGKSFSPSQSNLSHLFEQDTNRSFRVSLFLCSLLFSFFSSLFFIPFFLYTARLGGSVGRFNAAIGIFRRGRKIELPCIHFGRRAAVLEFNGNEDTSIERTGPIVIL